MAKLPTLPNFEEPTDYESALRVVQMLIRYIRDLTTELEKLLP